MLSLSSALAASASAQGNPADDPQVVREALTAVNKAWSKVRLDYDSSAADAMLTPDFFVTLADRKVGRAEFIRMVSARTPNVRLVRFDNPILTIVQQPGKDEWTAVVQEKMEVERTNQDGTKSRVYAMWITRDGYRRASPGKWMLTSSEEIMHEGWRNGRKPPFLDWE